MTGSKTSSRRLAVPVVCALTAVAVLVLVATRAVMVPLTFDEAVTYERTVDASPLAVLDFRTATNHLLNTLLTRASHAVFGSAVWALRLPSVLAAAGFLAALAAFARRMRHAGIAAAGFVVLATNLYALDYFALSRGYGLVLCTLTAALYALVRWVDAPDDGRWLKWALGAAALAVVANFAVLPAMAALAVVVVVRGALRPAAVRVVPAPSRRGPAAMAAIVVAAAAFSLVVFSRDRALSPSLYTPVSVRVIGLLDDELADVFVYRQDVRGEFRPLLRGDDGVWRTGDVRDTWGLKIDLPKAHDRNLAAIEVAIGGRVFRRTRLDEGPWTGYDWRGRRMLRSTEALAAPRSAVPGIAPAINWGGDAAHWRLAAIHAAGVVGVLLASWAALAGLGRAAVRWGVVRDDEWRWITGAALAVGGVCAAPLYLLQRNGELYYGGVSGLIPDTLGSLISGTLYTRAVTLDGAYGAAWTLGLLAVATGVAGVRAPSRDLARAPLAVLGLGGLVLLMVRLQHDLLGAPYPFGRTGLYLWPIAGVWLWLLADRLADSGRALRAATTAAALAIAALSGWHAVAVFNLRRTFDDYADAAVPAVLRAIAEDVGAQRRPPPFIHLGVEWIVSPAARYYADRLELPRSKILVHVVPDAEVAADYVYVLNPQLAQGSAIQAFPEARGTLYRVPPAAPEP